MRRIRLFNSQYPMKSGQIISFVGNDFNYLTRVMRQKVADEFLLFNGQDGEFLVKIITINKRDCLTEVIEKTKDQYLPPKITLAFSLIKALHIDFIGQKATELGVTSFQPIITDNTIVNKINFDRFQSNLKEAAEQCERLDLPSIGQTSKLDNFLKNLTPKQILIWCDESGNGQQAKQVLQKINYPSDDQEIIILTGPEGGFSKNELQKLANLKNSYAINLGPRILRADTACIAAITLVQELIGDFNLKCRF